MRILNLFKSITGTSGKEASVALDPVVRTTIFAFTTGRSGTGFLSQVFGHGPFDKNTVHRVGNALVTHESWRKPPIEALKQLDLSSPQASRIVKSALEEQWKQLGAEHGAIDKYFIADHKIGRYFSCAMPATGYPFKVIRVHRDENEVLRSFTRIYNERKRDTDSETFERFMRNNWSRNYFAPTDFSAIQKVSPEQWLAMDYIEQFQWYIEEVNLQWERAKKLLSPDDYIEIEFEDLTSGASLSEIEMFIDIPYAREYADVTANHKVQTSYR